MTTISQERSKLAAVKGAPTLRRRDSWGSTFSYTGRFTVTEPATRVFIHISVTNPGNYNSNDAHARALESIGRQRFPNTGVSYNRGCMPNAALYELQPIGRQGAHTVNDFRRSTCSTSGCPGKGKSLTAPSWNLNVNARAYVICQNVGNAASDAQVDALARAIVADYRAGFITKAAAENPHGHRCVSSKSCPGDKMWAKMSALATKIKHYVNNGLGGNDMPITNDDADKIASRVWRELQESPLDADTEYFAMTFLRFAWSDGKRILTNQAKQLIELAAIKKAVGAVVDEDAIAQQVAALAVPAVVSALAGVGQLTTEQVEDAAEQAIRNVLGTLDADA